MYADDTTFYVTGNNTDELNYKLNEDAKSITNWCNVNKMVINKHKTKCMIVTTQRRHRYLTDMDKKLNVIIGGEMLEQVHFDKILGVWVDDRL
ncbi:hypothetical protein, partial [Salmonella sp. s51944]|uniref:hypothetical protein n=1 Tax=Salmonella sp. s51944 TaxID=3159655 RepID=UPI00397EA2F1